MQVSLAWVCYREGVALPRAMGVVPRAISMAFTAANTKRGHTGGHTERWLLVAEMIMMIKVCLFMIVLILLFTPWCRYAYSQPPTRVIHQE